MADFLQRLIVAIAMAATAAAQSKTFSHRVHLKLGLTCVRCHAQAPASTVASDNLLPAIVACAPCHKDMSIPAPPATLVNRFSHQQHLRMGNFARIIAAAIDAKSYLSAPGDLRRHLNTTNACSACHRGIEESDAVSRFNMPQMADCLVCHTQIDPPFSCEQCHARGPHLKPASHTRDYIDTHSSGKLKLDKPSCVICHGREFRCLGCH
ncbi:MAG: hypothetical protein ACRD44_08455 [Bryobacteraceae bacterium]